MAFERVSSAKERIPVLDGSRVTQIFALTFW